MKEVILGMIGAGRAGTVMARLALKAGYQVLVSNSRGPESLALMIDVLMPGAFAASPAEAAGRSDIVVLALPLGRYQSIPAGPLAGKTVIDAMNYWAVGVRRIVLPRPRESSSK